MLQNAKSELPMKIKTKMFESGNTSNLSSSGQRSINLIIPCSLSKRSGLVRLNHGGDPDKSGLQGGSFRGAGILLMVEAVEIHISYSFPVFMAPRLEAKPRSIPKAGTSRLAGTEAREKIGDKRQNCSIPCFRPETIGHNVLWMYKIPYICPVFLRH